MVARIEFALALSGGPALDVNKVYKFSGQLSRELGIQP
jgi:hypothetical protein